MWHKHQLRTYWFQGVWDHILAWSDLEKTKIDFQAVAKNIKKKLGLTLHCQSLDYYYAYNDLVGEKKAERNKQYTCSNRLHIAYLEQDQIISPILFQHQLDHFILEYDIDLFHHQLFSHSS